MVETESRRRYRGGGEERIIPARPRTQGTGPTSISLRVHPQHLSNENSKASSSKRGGKGDRVEGLQHDNERNTFERRKRRRDKEEDSNQRRLRR